jgi:aminomethyltransferase
VGLNGPDLTLFSLADDMTDLIRKTPLNALHREAGARMVDFAGWEMPVHYGSQVEEHHAVRRDAGMFDVSHMRVLDIHGASARAWLQKMLANDVARLSSPGRALYSCMLDAGGGVIDDLIVYRMPDGGYRMVVNAGTADGDIRWLKQNIDPGVVLDVREDLAILAVQGPRARERCWEARPAWRVATEGLKPFHAVCIGGDMVARTGYTGEDGFEIIIPATCIGPLWTDLRASGVKPAGLGARDTLRLEAGMNLYGQDMDSSVTPLECGLAWTVSGAGERAFIGSDALVVAPGSLQVGAILIDRGVMRSHQTLRTKHGMGVVTSGGFSPTMNQSIALCRVPAGVLPGDDIEVEVRGHWLRAKAVKPPFVRNGRILIEGVTRAGGAGSQS